MAADNVSPGSSPIGKWTNKKCIEIAFTDYFPTSVKDIQVQKKIIVKYLNAYLGGKLKGLKMTDLAFAVISIMPKDDETESFIWESKHYKEDGTLFHLPPEEKLQAEVGNTTANENVQEQNVQVESSNLTQDNISSTSANTNNVEEANKFRTTDSKASHESDVINPAVKVNGTENVLPNDGASTSRDNVHTTGQANRIYNNYYDIPEFPADLQWFSRCPDKKVMEDDIPYYGPAENSAFNASCNKLLEQWDTNAKSRIVLKYLFGIIALITMRAATKKYTHLVNTFRSRKFLTHIAFADTFVKYSIPHKRFVKNCYRMFSRRDGKIPVMFAKIVLNSFHIDAMLRVMQPKHILMKKLNVFKLTVLSHTADYGFGLVTMLQNIDARIGATGVKAIRKATFCDKTAESWSKLMAFLHNYMASKSKEATHHWARVINIQFFEDLTCANNYTLSVILGVFIEKLTNNSNIWQSAWVSSHPENINELKDLGYKMFKKMSEEVNLVTLLKEVEAKKRHKTS